MKHNIKLTYHKFDDDPGYYDVDEEMESSMLTTGYLDDLFTIRDLKQRKLFIDTDIDQFTAGKITKHILQINKEDRDVEPKMRAPILIYIASNGGEVDAGFEIIDAIMCSKTPVYTINLGYQYSMSFLIGLAGDKRFAMKNSKILMHDGSNFVYNSGAKAQDQMEFQRKVEDRVRDYILSRSKLSKEEYDSKLRVEWYLFADEAKGYGFVDYIVGEDCEIDMVI